MNATIIDIIPKRSVIYRLLLLENNPINIDADMEPTPPPMVNRAKKKIDIILHCIRPFVKLSSIL